MATQQWKHQVFISFRGEDTRYNFVCHLYDALRRTGLKTFVDDQLPRGEEINSVLLQAIHDSKVALIIFSENYASSSWCLDELLKIIECHETHNQIVIPVFYRVNPSDVRKRNGKFGESFAKLIEDPRYSNKIRKWKDALTKAANKSGWDSDVIREDNKLIDQIVKDVSDKLKHLYPCSLEGVVGLNSATGSSDVRMLGITPLYMQVDEGYSGVAPLYMQVDEDYVQGDDDDQDDEDEDAYWMLESSLPRKMSTKMKMKLKKKIKDYDEDMNSEEDSDDDMIPEDDYDELFETDEDELFETEDELSEASDELSETTSSRD